MKPCTSCSRPLLPVADACPFCGVRLSTKWLTAAGAAVVTPFLLSACYGGPMLIEDCSEEDFDADGWPGFSNCTELLDCDDANGNVNPAAAEVCDDGVDNNCDGISAGTDQLEICDNGLDDDCDGEIDETDDGVETADECLDGVDNDCDGMVDSVDPDCWQEDVDTSEDGAGDLTLSYVFDGSPDVSDCASAGLLTLTVEATGPEAVPTFDVACDDSDIELSELATGVWSVQVSASASGGSELWSAAADEIELSTQGATVPLTLTCTAADGVTPCAPSDDGP